MSGRNKLNKSDDVIFFSQDSACGLSEEIYWIGNLFWLVKGRAVLGHTDPRVVFEGEYRGRNFYVNSRYSNDAAGFGEKSAVV